MKIKTQIRKRLMWHLHIDGWHDLPKPDWFYYTEGWIDDPKEIENAIRLDDDMTVTTAAKNSPKTTTEVEKNAKE